MRRIRAAATPAVFFLGLALICGSLIEYARWTIVEVTLSEDFSSDPAQATYVDLDWALHQSHDSLVLPIIRLADAASYLGAAGGCGALLLVFLKRRRLGAWLFTASMLVGLAPAIAWGQQYRVVWGRRWSCTMSYSPPPLGPLVVEAITFASVMAVLIALAWLVAQRQAGVPLRPATWVAVGVALCMLGVTLLYAEAAAEQLSPEHLAALPWPRPQPVSPDRPTLWLCALTVAGLAISATRPLYVSRLVSTSALLLGVLMTVPAVAIVHDEALARETGHDGHPVSLGDASPLATSRCDPLRELALEGTISPTQFLISGNPVGSFEALEAPLFIEVREAIERINYVADRNDLSHSTRFELIVDRTVPLHVIRQTLRALARVGVKQVDLLSHRTEPVPLWLRPEVHRHTCVVPIELSDEGTPLTDFADWAALVHVADQPGTPLRVKPL